MFTDIVGSSKIAQKNLNLGIKAQEEHFKIIFQYLKQFDGNLVKDMGDGTLSYFDSAVDAVKCAINIMNDVIELNNERKEKWHLRIGIHIGEVHIKENDILGDTVNVASRIESSADPDSILISHDVFKMVKRSIALSTVKIGPKDLKNIEDKHILYKVLGEATKGLSRTKISRKMKKRIIFISAFSFLVILTVLFYMLFPFQFTSIFKDINPDSFSLDNKTNQLRILNKKGDVLWVKKISDEVDENDISKRVKISDLNNDRKNEVIIGYHTYDDTTKFATLSCYDLSGEVKWITPFSKKVRNYVENDESSPDYYYSPYYSIGELFCDDLNNDGDKEIILNYINKKYWPSFLAIIDSKGNFIYQVLNGGHISSIGIYDVDKDNIKDVFAGGLCNYASDDISAVLLYLNGKRILNNDGLWRDKICMSPVQKNIQTVDGYFYPQKSIIPLLLCGNQWEESIHEKFIFYDEYLEITTTCGIPESPKRLSGVTLYLYYDFKRFRYVTVDDYYDEIKKVLQNILVTEEKLEKYYKQRYIYPQRLYYYNFEKMCIDTLFTSNYRSKMN